MRHPLVSKIVLEHNKKDVLDYVKKTSLCVYLVITQCLKCEKLQRGTIFTKTDDVPESFLKS